MYAMKEEIDAIEENDIWELCKLPKGKISCWFEVGI